VWWIPLRHLGCFSMLDVEASPNLRRDLLSFVPAFGEPVTAPHVGHTWPLGWTVGSNGGDFLRASPAMKPKAKAKRHECPTCGPGTGSPNVKSKLNRSRLNLGLPWMLTLGGPLLRRTENPQLPFKEPRWMADRRITVCMPRVTLSIGVGCLKMEPGNYQTVGGASKRVWLERPASKQARLEWPCR